MFSGKKATISDKILRQGERKIDPRKSLQVAVSGKVVKMKSPIRIIKTMKSQSNVNVVGIKKVGNLGSTCGIVIKSIEKKIGVVEERKEPSPIVSRNKKGFYSMNEEEYKELNIFLKEMNK